MSQITCEFTGGRKNDQIQEADAVLYSSVFDNDNKMSAPESHEMEELNKIRKANQIWAWFQWESPAYHRENLKPYDGFFNATMTYRYDSTLWMPYSSIATMKMNIYGVVSKSEKNSEICKKWSQNR